MGPETALTFIGLWGMADRAGRLEDKPGRIQATLWPFKFQTVDVEKQLKLLASGPDPFIVRYDGHIQIVNFSKHQNPHPREKPSTIPPISKSREKALPGREKALPSTADVLIPDILNPDVLIPKEVCAEPVDLGSPPSPPLLSIPCLPGKRSKQDTWHLTEEKLAEYKASFPAVDVLSTIRVARQWCIDNPARRKTFQGVPSFLGRWLAREQNRGGNHHGGTFARSTKHIGAVASNTKYQSHETQTDETNLPDL